MPEVRRLSTKVLMSMEKKMREAMTRAATEAVQRERGRCLWLLDALLDGIKLELGAKLLIEQQRHLIATKLKIAQVVVSQIKRAIVSDMRPATPLENLPIPVKDVNEMGKRIEELTSLLCDVGFDGTMTANEVRERLTKWSNQEDEIDELRSRIQELEHER